jgi:hypothetical protein
MAAGRISGVHRCVRSRHIEFVAAVVEEGADGMSDEVDLLLFGASIRVLECQLVDPAVYALEVGEAGQEFRLTRRRTIARRSDKAGYARAHPFDGLGTKTDLLDVYSWREIFGHR